MYTHKLTSYCVQFSITRDLNMQARKKDRFWTFYKWYIWPTSLRHELSIQLYTFILIHALRSFRLVKCLIILLQMYVISDYEVIYIFSSFFHGRGLDERQKIRCRREIYGVIYICCQFVPREAGLGQNRDISYISSLLHYTISYVKFISDTISWMFCKEACHSV